LNSTYLSWKDFTALFFRSPSGAFYISPSNCNVTAVSFYSQSYETTYNKNVLFNLSDQIRKAWSKKNNQPESAIPAKINIELNRQSFLTKSLGSICGDFVGLSYDEALSNLLGTGVISIGTSDDTATVVFLVDYQYYFEPLDVTLLTTFSYITSIPCFKNTVPFCSDCNPYSNDTKIYDRSNFDLNDNNSGQKIKDGLSLAIIGSPNVGKSSLLNFLAKSEVAIVSEIAGTTRDVIEVHLEIAGVAVRLADTAGLRLSKNKIENEGIKRAQKKASQADIKILVVDAKKKKLSPQDLDLIDHKTIVVANKIDLIRSSKISDLKAINISLKTKENLDLLINKIEEKVLENLPKVSSPLITQERYRQSLIDALEAIKNFSLEKNIELAAEDLRIASLAIGKITGRINVDDVLDVVFSKFCIGK